MIIIARLRRSALCAIVPIAFLAGCGGSLAPVGTADMRQPTIQRATSSGSAQSKSWMLPEAQSEDLLYVALTDQILVFSYPSGKSVGAIDYNAYGLCSDKAGNVFATDHTYGQIAEYPHGSLTPIATLHYPNNSHHPLDCADDSNTTTLAVTSSSKHAGVSLFKTKRTPDKNYYYPKPSAAFWQCVYDSESNLFVNVTQGNSLMTELPKGGSKFLNLKLKGSSGFRQPTPVQWDGEYLVIGNQTGSSNFTIYRLKIKGSTLSIVGTVGLNAYGVGSIWFEPGRLIGTSVAGVSIWKYPAGGNPILTIAGTGGGNSVTVSLASK